MFRRLILAAALAACGLARAELPETIARLLEAAGIPQEAAGIVVLRGDTVLVSHNADLSMQPGSTMKLFTTMAALEQLGPAFRGRTELRSDAELVHGVLQGDLYLRGGADGDFNEDALQHMLQALRNQGIRKIKGDIVLDRQLFQPARPDVGLAPFDEFPWAYYNVIPDALLVNTNLLKVELRSTATELKLVMMPAMEKVSVGGDIKLVDGDCAAWESGWRTPELQRSGATLKVVLHGSFPKNCSKSIGVNLLDHHDYLDRLLRASWDRLGGSLGGTVREAEAATTTPAGARLLAEHVSRALPEVLRDINKQSDNTLARTLYLSLGSLEADAVLGSHPIALPADGAPATTAARAEQAIRAWLRDQHIGDQGLVLDNGSGLSRSERATAMQLAGVLQAGQRSLWMPEFVSSLPIAAVDGTMRRRLKNSASAARARFKTGSLTGVISVAGYVQDADNRPCVVVAMLNHEKVANGAGRAVLDGVIDWVGRGAPTGQPAISAAPPGSR